MSQQLEEKIILLEKRISTIEDQLREGKAPIQAPPGKASWRQLKKGMSEAEVEGLLGSPAKIENYGSFSIWNYQKGGSVQFNEDALVKGWFEP